MYSTEILSNTATIREVNSLRLTQFLLKNVQRELTHEIGNALLECRATNSQTFKLHNLKELSYVDFPCHVKMKKVKKGRKVTMTVNSFTKIDQLDGSARSGSMNEKIRPAPGTNQIS